MTSKITFSKEIANTIGLDEAVLLEHLKQEESLHDQVSMKQICSDISILFGVSLCTQIECISVFKVSPAREIIPFCMSIARTCSLALLGSVINEPLTERGVSVPLLS